MAYIYQIKNKINNKFYIGSTNNYKRRWCKHKYELRNNKHNNKYLQSSWNKYGENNFEFSVLEECNVEEQYKREQYYMDIHKPHPPNGYNICTNASGGYSGLDSPNCVYTEQQILKVKRMLCDRMSYSYIHKITNVNTSTIKSIAHLRSWENIGSKHNEKLIDIYSEENKLSENELTEDIIIQAYQLKNNNIPMKEIYYILQVKRGSLKQPLIVYEAKLRGKKIKKCEICDKDIVVKSNNQKYCKRCSKEINIIKSKNNIRKYRENNKISA